jgi:Na+-translocating ferredoxin:NAD+ oxidoreductase RnfG subunit
MLDHEVDGFSGASVTGNALEMSVANVAIYHRWEFEGVKELTAEEQFEAYQLELFPTATRFDDVTAFKPYSPIISTIYDAYDETDTFLGTIYHVATIGASYSEITVIEFLIGVDSNTEYTGFRMVSDTETEGRADAFYADGYGDTIIGDDITDPVGLDGVAQSTLSYNRIVNAMTELAIYHNEKYIGRPDSVDVDNAELLAAFPTATQFVSVYEDYDYANVIGNIYEAQDGGGTTLGHVYFGYADGFGGTPIEFTWGVANDGTTQVLHIVADSESWDMAEDFGGYNGAAGTNFSTSSWLNNFNGIDIASILTSPVDAVAGVSTTTGGMNNTLETIAEYHDDQSVGGGS